jgi:4-hydroxybenzoate polyprenyltransferase
MAALAHRATARGPSGVPPGLAPWSIYLRLGRVSNLPTVWTNVLAGALLSAADVEAITLGALIIACSLFYEGGMYLNDAFDRAIDAGERPERPIPAGLISARQVFLIGFGLLGGGVLLLLLPTLRTTPPNWPALLSGVALAAVIVYYDATHKRDPRSPFVMGLCRVLTYVTAALASAGGVNRAVIGGALVLLAYLIGLTYVAKQETLTEMRSIWPLAFLAAPFVYTLPSLAGPPIGIVLWAGLFAWAGYAISLLVRRGRVNIPRAVVSLIAGISLLDALLIAGAGHPDAALLGIAGFGLTLYLQRWVSGT